MKTKKERIWRWEMTHITTSMMCTMETISELSKYNLFYIPQSFVLVAIIVELNAETVFLVFLPVANVSGCVHPFLSLDTTIFLSLLLLNPVN